MRTKEIGIYQLLCLSNGKKYVGASQYLSRRKRQHFYDLRHNQHANPRIQADFNFIGEKKFVFSILEVLPAIDNLLEREQFWIDALKPEYNAELKAGFSVEHVHRKDVKEKISKSVQKLWENPEYREKHCKPRNWKNGIPNRKGVKLSEETKQKLREANLGKNNPNYGTHRTKEAIQKMVEKTAKTYSGAISPDGTVYAPIHNMSAFCRERNLCISSMVALMRGRIKHHKGWTRFSG